jgi:RNA polymerase sigma-70 factor (ECF subfamily)
VFGQGFDAVLRAARHGDESAVTALYLELNPVVTGYLAGQRCPSPEDVASITMEQVFRDLRTFDGDEGKFRSWVFTIAHHRMIDAARAARARPFDATEHDKLERAAGAHRGIEDEVVTNLGASEVDHLLVACTHEQRNVILLRYVADLSLQQVAEVLGKDYNTVKATHRRAITALRAHIEAGEYPGPAGRTLTESG